HDRDDLQSGLLEADYIVIELARHILGEDWMPKSVQAANAGGIERVLVSRDMRERRKMGSVPLSFPFLISQQRRAKKSRPKAAFPNTVDAACADQNW
ncbi:MAG: DUF3400 domain-containing protein, partial [Burkholderiales bacterium]|nr:DUF3400 domain-containing protein [Burkholderiales bacterium]